MVARRHRRRRRLGLPVADQGRRQVHLGFARDARVAATTTNRALELRERPFLTGCEKSSARSRDGRVLRARTNAVAQAHATALRRAISRNFRMMQAFAA